MSKRSLITKISLLIFILIAADFSYVSAKEVKIVTINGAYNYRVEIADTPDKWQTGLKGKGSMPDNEGMLFLFPYESIRAFTTIGMKFPIDLIFFDSSFTVIGILRNVQPEEKSLLLPIPILGALEIKASDKSPKISLGDKILFVDFSYRAYTKLRDAK